MTRSLEGIASISFGIGFAVGRGMRHLAILGILASACTPHVFSPPGRTIPLEGPATIDEGDTAIQVEGGMSAEVFGEPIVHGTVRLRHGVSDRLELSGEANAMFFTLHEDASTDAHRGIYGARFGVKGGFGEHFSLTGGMAGGGSSGGGFLSPDVGFIGGYTNPYCIPFFATRVFFSQPLNTNTITITDNEETFVGEPQPSFGVAIATGVRIPFGPRYARHGAVAVGYGFTLIADGDESKGFQGFNVGIELKL